MEVLSSWAFRDLSYMMSDRNLVMTLLETDEKNLAKFISVNKDGSITIGKTSFKLINRLFGAEKTLDPETVCLRLIKIITGFGSGRNDAAYKDLCQRFTEYYKDGNYSLAISAIFVAYRFVLAPDIKVMTQNSPTVEKGNFNKKSDVLINGVLIKDGSGQAVVVDLTDPYQVLFRRP